VNQGWQGFEKEFNLGYIVWGIKSNFLNGGGVWIKVRDFGI
jgi:hypothetical protein